MPQNKKTCSLHLSEQTNKHFRGKCVIHIGAQHDVLFPRHLELHFVCLDCFRTDLLQTEVLYLAWLKEKLATFPRKVGFGLLSGILKLDCKCFPWWLQSSQHSAFDLWVFFPVPYKMTNFSCALLVLQRPHGQNLFSLPADIYSKCA